MRSAGALGPEARRSKPTCSSRRPDAPPGSRPAIDQPFCHTSSAAPPNSMPCGESQVAAALDGRIGRGETPPIAGGVNETLPDLADPCPARSAPAVPVVVGAVGVMRPECSARKPGGAKATCSPRMARRSTSRSRVGHRSGRPARRAPRRRRRLDALRRITGCGHPRWPVRSGRDSTYCRRSQRNFARPG